MFTQSCLKRIKTILPSSAKNEVDAVCCKMRGRCLANPAGGAGYERCFSFHNLIFLVV